MCIKKILLLSLALLTSKIAVAGTWENEYTGYIRSLAGFANIAHADRNDENKYHFPATGYFENQLTYTTDNDLSISLFTSVTANSGANLDNLNQGHWGEEIYGEIKTTYGDLQIGQMANAAVQNGVNRPNFSSWSTTPTDIVNFINNPNWQQRKHTKYYNSLTSTLINTDGSSFKVSYFSPELYGTSFGISYIPENNANDGLTSKFSPYRKENAYIFSLYNTYDIGFADMEIYAAFADYHQSHNEYAGGLSFYRKGWTLFGSYRQTQTSHSDYTITRQTVSKNQVSGYDAYRHSKAWNGGIGYEWAFLNSTVSYFESRASDNTTRNRIINWHNSIRPHKNFGFYAGTAWVDFEPDRNNIQSQKRGMAFYAGFEINL